MDTKTVDALLEKIFSEAEVEDMPEPEGTNPRFKWQPPKEPYHPQPVTNVRKWVPPRLKAAINAAPAQLENPEDRIGKYSMQDILPAKEVATPDNLIDLYQRIQNTADPVEREKLQKEFQAHRTEFESRMRHFVDSLLG